MYESTAGPARRATAMTRMRRTANERMKEAEHKGERMNGAAITKTQVVGAKASIESVRHVQR